ncbi:hypothetical protein EVAR_53465_1 [Eumeta japonica]|uniref:Uncharacterized protein n=1 Tax=Eumeta variegata TaxID=151549 RepID=A0A4C1XU07_EUMVA|nr:hypothetical protein EVAR_53465_1 [Eumeta japonica]
MENNPDRFSVIARSRKQVARPQTSRARCDPPISARRSPSSRHLAPINAQLMKDKRACGPSEGRCSQSPMDTRYPRPGSYRLVVAALLLISQKRR